MIRRLHALPLAAAFRARAPHRVMSTASGGEVDLLEKLLAQARERDTQQAAAATAASAKNAKDPSELFQIQTFNAIRSRARTSPLHRRTH